MGLPPALAGCYSKGMSQRFDVVTEAARAVHGDRVDAYVDRLRAFAPNPSPAQVRTWLRTLRMQATSTLPKAFIFDADGTLCDVRGVRHYVTGKYRDFDTFHRASNFCPPNEQVADLANRVSEAGMAVVVTTARQHRYHDLTVGWMAKHGVAMDALFMRADNDTRPDYEVKRDILAVIRRRFNVIGAVDDNPQVLRLWDEVGIAATEVPGFDPQVEGVLEVVSPF